MNYSVFHVETYGHGTRERNNLAEAQKVTIEDHDGHFFVYECESDTEAQKIAQWFCDIERETKGVSLEQHDPRAFSVCWGEMGNDWASLISESE